METRKITVVSTRNQKRSTIMSTATTLGELKVDLDNAGIDYSDMTFYEGLTKTEIINNESLLPTNVSYKGQITNELVFMLTNMNKKIKSGTMTRAEAYQYIKENNLQLEVLKRYGKNYTVCKTPELLALIEETMALDKEDSCQYNSKVVEAFELLLDYLHDKGIILSSQIKIIRETLRGVTNSEVIKSSYSESDIDDMFDFVPNK